MDLSVLNDRFADLRPYASRVPLGAAGRAVELLRTPSGEFHRYSSCDPEAVAVRTPFLDFDAAPRSASACLECFLLGHPFSDEAHALTVARHVLQCEFLLEEDLSLDWVRAWLLVKSHRLASLCEAPRLDPLLAARGREVLARARSVLAAPAVPLPGRGVFALTVPPSEQSSFFPSEGWEFVASFYSYAAPMLSATAFSVRLVLVPEDAALFMNRYMEVPVVAAAEPGDTVEMCALVNTLLDERGSTFVESEPAAELLASARTLL